MKFMTEKYLVDTNIIVYAFVYDDPKKQEISYKLLLNAFNDVNANFSIQNIAEFANVMQNKFKLDLNSDHLRSIVYDLRGTNSNILYYSFDTITGAINICTESELHFFDALLAQTMIENGITTIYTENESDFKKVKGLKVINPFKK